MHEFYTSKYTHCEHNESGLHNLQSLQVKILISNNNYYDILDKCLSNQWCSQEIDSDDKYSTIVV